MKRGQGLGRRVERGVIRDGCPLPIVCCPLPVARCLLTVAHCPLSVVRCLLSVDYGLRPFLIQRYNPPHPLLSLFVIQHLKKGDFLRSKHVYSNALEGSKKKLKFDSTDHQSATFWGSKGSACRFLRTGGRQDRHRKRKPTFFGGGTLPLLSVLQLNLFTSPPRVCKQRKVCLCIRYFRTSERSFLLSVKLSICKGGRVFF